jgi:hypothetical protein
VANSKKEMEEKKRKFVREKEKEKKISLYRKKPHTSSDF